MILAIIQARWSSQRLPGKVLMPILGIPMLQLQVERVLRSSRIDKLIIATSSHPSDDKLENLCRRLNIFCFRGSLDDVLDRFYNAANIFQPDHVVRLTGDCPLIDPELIDATVDFYFNGDYDYASNVLEPTFPDGLDVEIFRFSVLKTIWEKTSNPVQREHVTLSIYKNPQVFRIGSYKNSQDISDLRWTVDEPEDLQFVTNVFSHIYPEIPDFRMRDVLNLLQKYPELKSINSGYLRNQSLINQLRSSDENK